MPRFKLVVRDATGATRSTTVTAASAEDVADLAARKGYELVRIEPLPDPDPDAETLAPPPADIPPPAKDLPGDEPVVACPPRSWATPIALAALGLAGMAILVSLTTLGYVLIADPLAGGLSGYDLSSPRASFQTEMQIRQKADFRAGLEYQRRFGDRTPGGRLLAEKLATYELRKEIDYGSRKGLLVSYKQAGEKRHQVLWYEKDGPTGWWVETDIPLKDIEKQDRELADHLRRFESSGELPPAKKSGG